MVTGAMFWDLVLFLREQEDIGEYSMIVVHGGINVLQKSPGWVQADVSMFVEALKEVHERCPNTEILVSLPLRYENLDVSSFNDSLRSSLSDVEEIEILESIEPFWKNGQRVMTTTLV